MDRVDDILKTLDVIPSAKKLLETLECVDKANDLTDVEARSCIKLFICCCDESHLDGIKNRLKVLTG